MESPLKHGSHIDYIQLQVSSAFFIIFCNYLLYVNKILHPFLTSAEPMASSTISLPESSTALPFHMQSPDTATHRSAKQKYCIKYVHNNSKKWDGRRLWLDGAWLEELYPAEELLPGKAITLPWHKRGLSELLVSSCDWGQRYFTSATSYCYCKSKHIRADASVGIAYASLHAGPAVQ